METKAEIQQKYQVVHNALGTREDAPDKDWFDQQHAQVWADCDTELKARKAYLEANPSPDTAVELAQLEDMFPTPHPPTPDELRAKEILNSNPDSIPMPELLELLHIIGRRLGFDV